MRLLDDGVGGPIARQDGSGIATGYDYDVYGRLVGLVNSLLTWRRATPTPSPMAWWRPLTNSRSTTSTPESHE